MRDSAHSSSVRAWEETMVIPTYPVPVPDKNPMFLEKRVNQGSSGRIYPNPLTDHLSNEKVDRPYQAVHLENEYLQLVILPELGGRIFAGTDRTNGYDFFYRQHVVKPALIGLFGPWISGGVEFNWPQHHRPSTFMPVDHLIQECADGSRIVWLGEHEPMERTKGMVGVCLHPGRAYVEIKVRLYNRTPFVRTFLWWANAAVHVNERYQVFFPPDVTYVTFHARQDMAHYPIARGTYCGIDLGEGTDIRWYKNWPESTSFFVGETRYDFFGGYDHGREAGVVHVGNRHIAPGKKLFTWGNGDLARAWERNLTDADGPYAELMAGYYTDNQPDFSYLQPYETKTFSQYWYPIQRIGPACNANRDLAVSLVAAGREARVGVCATTAFPGATVRLTAGDRVLLTRRCDLAPGAPLLQEVRLPAGVAETDLLLRICAEDRRELIRYRPEVPERRPLPDPATAPPLPQEVKTADELYLTGLHLEQYRHATWSPEPYWQEVLRRDPADARCNNALGLVCLKRGQFDQAEAHLRRAIATLTRRNPNPRDGEPYYNLGLALQFQHRLDEAYAAFYKGTWSYAWQAPGHYALAEIDCRRGDYTSALEHLERSLLANPQHLKARDLTAAILRRLHKGEVAGPTARGGVYLDPLDFWARNEQVLAARASHGARAHKPLRELSGLMRGQAQTYLDVAFDYAAAGLWDEAADLLGRLDGPGAVHPMVLYTLGYFAQQRGREEDARELYRRAAQMPPDYCFPVRLQELEVLQAALAADPGDARAAYYLGNLLYDKERYEEAIRSWETSCRLDPTFATAWRNLGLASYNVRRDPERARSCYEKAFAADPRDPRLLYELDQLLKRLGAAPAERLALLEARLDLVDQSDVLAIERASLHNLLGRPQKALQIIQSRQFHPWEGGERAVPEQYAAAHWLLGREALEAGRPAEGLAHFEAGQESPYGPSAAPELTYYAGLACEALGDGGRAEACFRQVAAGQGGLSPAACYQALALQRLGEQEAARSKLQELLDLASRELQAGAAPAYFGTSLASFSLFEDDLGRLDRIRCAYVTGLARLGLGEVAEARRAFEEVVALDASHLGAAVELQRLAKAES